MSSICKTCHQIHAIYTENNGDCLMCARKKKKVIEESRKIPLMIGEKENSNDSPGAR